MVYTASLSAPVKRALGRKVMQSNLNKICEKLVMDPEVTNMDVVILGPKDAIGPRAVKLQKALQNKHPDICVIYLYTKDAEKDSVETEYKMQAKSIRPNVITEAFEQFVGDLKIRQGKQQMSSADFDQQAAENIKSEVSPAKNHARHLDMSAATGTIEGPEVQIESTTGVQSTIKKLQGMEHATEITPLPELDAENLSEDHAEYVKSEAQPMDTQPEDDFEIPAPLDDEPKMEIQTPEISIPEPEISIPEPEVPETPEPEMHIDIPAHPTPEAEPVVPVEQALSSVRNVEEWSLFKEHMQHDAMVKSLINENSEYYGLVQMLETLDKRIEAVYRDTAYTADQKFEKIKEIGLERSVVRAKSNSIYVEKVISIISTIVLSAKRTVEEKIQSIDMAMYKINTDKKAIMDTSYIDKAIEERTKIQMELLNISRDIVDLYKSIDNLVCDEIDELDKKLPSSNQFINMMVEPIGVEIFTPSNTAMLANKLMRALQENRVVTSQLEESINAIVSSLFALCEKDEEIINYQQNVINMLKVNRIEDVIITNSLLKKCLHLYTGADNTGRSATAITHAGILSRINNSLLIDLTGRDKFADYGITPVSLDDFMGHRIEEDFLCVASDHILGPDELQQMVDEIKTRLNWYGYVNVILAPEDTNGIQQLSQEAMFLDYITDCSTTSINVMRDVIAKETTSNILHRLICINAPVSPLMLADTLNVDFTSVRIITLPNVQAIRACSIQHDRPYEYSDVRRIFEEAFRITASRREMHDSESNR